MSQTCRGSEHSIYNDYTMALAAVGGEGGLQLLIEESKKNVCRCQFLPETPYVPSVEEDTEKCSPGGAQMELESSEIV